jgi:hypothetical protein
MPRARVFTFAVAQPRTAAQWGGLVDMLRYDQALVLAVGTVVPGGRVRYVTLTTTGHPPEYGRWKSFGLPVLADADGPEPLPGVVHDKLRAMTADGINAL